MKSRTKNPTPVRLAFNRDAAVLLAVLARIAARLAALPAAPRKAKA